MTNPVEALTRAFLEADGYDPDYEMTATEEIGIAKRYREQAEIAVETLKGIGWGPAIAITDNLPGINPDGSVSTQRMTDTLRRSEVDA